MDTWHSYLIPSMLSRTDLTIDSLVLLQRPALILWYLPLLLIPFVKKDAAESFKQWTFHLFKVYIRLTEQVGNLTLSG